LNPKGQGLGSPAVKSLLSLLFALIILVAFGGLAFFFLNLSGGAKLERVEQKAPAPGTE